MATTFSSSDLVPSKSYFPALTGLRAVAALLVFLYHYVHGELIHGKISLDSGSFIGKLLYLTMHQGQVGVTIFFVLSGFLITNRYAISIEINKLWFRRYLQNRFARIYPIYFLLTVLTFTVMLSRSPYDWYEWPASVGISNKAIGIILNLTLLRSYFSNFIFLGVPTAWTLTIEETFYVCAPFLIVGLKRNFRRVYLYPLVLLAVGTLLVAICSRLPMCGGLMPDIPFMLSSTLFGRCLEFIAGIALSLSLNRKEAFITPRRSTLWGVTGILIGTTALAILERTIGTISAPPFMAYILVNNFLLPFPVTLLIWGLTRERTILQQVLASRLFNLLGKSSYVFYLIHLGVVDSFFITHFTDNWLARLVCYTLFSVALYKGVEHPLQKLLQAKIQPSKS